MSGVSGVNEEKNKKNLAPFEEFSNFISEKGFSTKDIEHNLDSKELSFPSSIVMKIAYSKASLNLVKCFKGLFEYGSRAQPRDIIFTEEELSYYKKLRMGLDYCNQLQAGQRVMLQAAFLKCAEAEVALHNVQLEARLAKLQKENPERVHLPREEYEALRAEGRSMQAIADHFHVNRRTLTERQKKWAMEDSLNDQWGEEEVKKIYAEYISQYDEENLRLSEMFESAIKDVK